MKRILLFALLLSGCATQSMSPVDVRSSDLYVHESFIAAQPMEAIYRAAHSRWGHFFEVAGTVYSDQATLYWRHPSYGYGWIADFHPVSDAETRVDVHARKARFEGVVDEMRATLTE